MQEIWNYPTTPLFLVSCRVTRYAFLNLASVEKPSCYTWVSMVRIHVSRLIFASHWITKPRLIFWVYQQITIGRGSRLRDATKVGSRCLDPSWILKIYADLLLQGYWEGVMINGKRSINHLAGNTCTWLFDWFKPGVQTNIGETYLLIYRSYVMRACGPDLDLSSKRIWKMCVIDAWTYYSWHVVTGPAGRVDRLKCVWEQLRTNNRK